MVVVSRKGEMNSIRAECGAVDFSLDVRGKGFQVDGSDSFGISVPDVI